MNYEAACKQATTDQGLDPILAVFTDEGLPIALEQTGGFTMVAYTYLNGRDMTAGAFGMTFESGEYMLCSYRDEEDEGAIVTTHADPRQIARMVRNAL
jgi:hypothetical protein